MDNLVVGEKLERAIQLFKTGEVAHSELLLQEVLKCEPDHWHALFMLGLIWHKKGRLKESIKVINKSINSNPAVAETHFNLGNALRDHGELEKAVDAYLKATELKPDYAPAYGNLGVVLLELDRLDEAAAVNSRVVQMLPNLAEAHLNLGRVFQKQNRFSDAVSCFAKAIQLNPTIAQAHLGLAQTLEASGQLEAAVSAYRRAANLEPGNIELYFGLGNLYFNMNRFSEAAEIFCVGLQYQPASPELFSNLGNSLSQLEKFDEAIQAYEKSLELNPELSETHLNLGNALRRKGRIDAALACYTTAASQNAKLSAAHLNIGHVLREKGMLDDSLLAYRRAIALDPECQSAHLNASWILLWHGNLKDGWGEHEWRLQSETFPVSRRFQHVAAWRGEDLQGRTIFVYFEQGLGDTIQFCRYLPLIAKRGGKVLFQCQKSLRPLLRTLDGISEFIAPEAVPRFDSHCALLSLPLAFGTELSNVPSNTPYLSAEQALSEKWKLRLGPRTGKLRVGIVWSGSKNFGDNERRSMTLAQMAAFVAIGDIEFFSLQKGEPSTQTKSAPAELRIADFTDELTDFSETAGLISNLDLIISVDTAVAHLAGAMAKSVWILLSTVPDWRWMLDRTDSPWYPTARLFRQKSAGDWCSVVEEVRCELIRLKGIQTV